MSWRDLLSLGWYLPLMALVISGHATWFGRTLLCVALAVRIVGEKIASRAFDELLEKVRR